MELDMQNKLIHKSINEQFLMFASSMWFKWNSQTKKRTNGKIVKRCEAR